MSQSISKTQIMIVSGAILCFGAIYALLMRPLPPPISVTEPALVQAFSQVVDEAKQNEIGATSAPANHETPLSPSTNPTLTHAQENWTLAISTLPGLQHLEAQVREFIPCSNETALLCSELAINLSHPDDLPLEAAQSLKEASLEEAQKNTSAYLAALETGLTRSDTPEGMKQELNRLKASILKQNGNESRAPASEMILTNPEQSDSR